jgi:hypothetical protein
MHFSQLNIQQSFQITQALTSGEDAAQVFCEISTTYEARGPTIHEREQLKASFLKCKARGELIMLNIWRNYYPRVRFHMQNCEAQRHMKVFSRRARTSPAPNEREICF